MNEIKLKKCPFCGGAAEMIDVNASISATKRTIYRVECKKGIECSGMPGTRGYDTEREAAAAWNKRAYEEDGRKTGKWEYRNLFRICSACGDMTGEKDDFNDWLPDKYCPNCGAKMEVDE